MAICEQAEKAFEKAVLKDEERRKRSRMIGYGVCPDCGEKLDHQDQTSPFRFFKKDWCDWTRSCPNHGIVDRGWYAGQ
jgi:hypothetical protein